MLDIRDLYKNDYIDKEVIISGWVKNHRKQAHFGFIDLSDGTYFKTLQVVYDDSLNSFEDVTKLKLGAAVTVTGNRAGGLFGVISSGVVTNSYTRATIAGLSGSAVKAGFAAEIRANGVNNNGGSGQIGLVRYCYAAVTFSGSGSAYAITMSLVHNYATFGVGSNRDGYVMDYLFDDGTDGGANYNNGSNIFSSDKIGAKKSSAEMRQASSYNTDNNNSDDFSSAYWNIGSAYATLKTER